MPPLDPIPVDASAGPRPGQFTAMISSTALDLPEHRKLVHQACLDAEVFPIGMEQLPAWDSAAVDVSLGMVDKADIYIGVYAFRYGWVPDGDEVSITEKEFDRALARKAEGKLREILVFTAHEEHTVRPRDVEADKDAQEKLCKFKERAAEGRVRKEFKSAEELHRLVLQALNEFKNRQQRAAGVATEARPAHTAIPNNLPHLQAFFGREAELAKIRKAIDPSSHTWGVLVDGSGGMGKTSLAVRAAYDCKPDQFKRIVFVSVKDRKMYDDGVRELRGSILPGFLEMCNELARRLGHADIAKAPEDQRIQLLHEALYDARALLVLDNLESLPESDRNQLLTFVEGLPQGCKAILTSREHFGNVEDGFELERLSRGAALAMIADLAGRNKQLDKSSEAERIAFYEETLGNPLLLRWVAGQVGRGSHRTLADALNFLRSCPEGNNPLEFVFGDLADKFTDDESNILCTLTYFTLPAKVEHVAPVADCDEVTADAALRSLANRSLVVPDSEETTFALVPMVADFLRRRKPEAVAEVGGRLEKHAYMLAVMNGYKKYDDFPALDAAWPTIAAALPRFIAGPNDRLQTVCDALRNFLNFAGHWDERLALSRDAEVKAVAAEAFLDAGWRAYEAGWTYYLRGQSAEVLACADRTESHWREAEAGARERATAIHLRGMGYRLAKDYPAATAAFREAVELDRTLSPESEDIAIDLNSLAGTELLSNNLDDAERDFREALRIAHAVNYREGVASYTGNLSALALAREAWPDAETFAREALLLAEKLGRIQLIADNCFRLAIALARQGRKAEALPHAQRAVDIYAALRHPDLEETRRILAESEV